MNTGGTKIMTLTEKAKELVFKKFGCKKQYALNAVDEIISVIGEIYHDYDYDKLDSYWEEVKKEIEKL